jgi:hypothetical protein
MAAVPRLSVYYNGEQVTAADMEKKKKKKKKKKKNFRIGPEFG